MVTYGQNAGHDRGILPPVCVAIPDTGAALDLNRSERSAYQDL